ncbi:hypothetical protein F0562_000450 [Nyssa sinensis]|uniref:Uncharacterized protein n=1 Tax=Nyssa sinensis TaxID=561372 RepID=A0A5J5C1J4_9ASTE|nr:hypothetical protein F0562_000450 [Nyssa sinensis]
MSLECKGKSSWPELVGERGEIAAATIEKENPFVTAEIVLKGTIVPADLVPVCSRVRVWVDNKGIVYQVEKLRPGEFRVCGRKNLSFFILSELHFSLVATPNGTERGG